jgi:ApaG protein
MRSFKRISGLRVEVQRVVYDETLAVSPERPYGFAYSIAIHNESEEPLRFFGRKWVLREVDGPTVVVEGDGIVGKFPRLLPGETFRYESYHTIAADSVVTGAFFGNSDRGELVAVPVPEFHLTAPMLA